MNINYINARDALVWATQYAVEEEFNHCLDRGDDLNVQDEHGRTALHAAAEEGMVHFAKVLLERGADYNRPDNEGDTPLDYAIFHEHIELADLLRQHGAKDREGKSAKQKLDDVIADGFASVDAAKRLFALIEGNKTPSKAMDQNQHSP
jgi:ankyrin repeat protein